MQEHVPADGSKKQPLPKAPVVEVDGAELGAHHWQTACISAGMPNDTPPFLIKPLAVKVAAYASANGKKNPDPITFAKMLEEPEKKRIIHLSDQPLETLFEDLSFELVDSPPWHAANGYHAIFFGAKDASGKISSAASKKGMAYRYRNQPFFKKQVSDDPSKARSVAVDKNYWVARHELLGEVETQVGHLYSRYLEDLEDIAKAAANEEGSGDFFKKEVEKETERINAWRAKAAAAAKKVAEQKEAKRVAELKRQKKERKAKVAVARDNAFDEEKAIQEVATLGVPDLHMKEKMEIMMARTNEMCEKAGMRFQEAWQICWADKKETDRILMERLAAEGGASSSAAHAALPSPGSSSGSAKEAEAKEAEDGEEDEDEVISAEDEDE